MVANLNDARRQRGDKLTVVGYETKVPSYIFQRQVQRLDGFHVHVVGRLVHDQHVVIAHHQLAKSRRPFFRPSTL